VVKLLLEKNADVNAQGGEYGNALQAASCRGRDQIGWLVGWLVFILRLVDGD
jgi:hypothetical protein